MARQHHMTCPGLAGGHQILLPDIRIHSQRYVTFRQKGDNSDFWIIYLFEKCIEVNVKA
jgi:hypothetical protein